MVDIQKPANKIEKLWVNNGFLFIEGLAFIHGYNSPEFSDLYKYLALKNVRKLIFLEYELGSVRRHELKAQSYKDKTYDYTAAGVATKGLKGIDISQLDEGIYEILISVSSKMESREYLDLILVTKGLNKRSADNLFEYRLYQKNSKTYLVKREIIGRFVSQHCYVGIEKEWVRGKVFHIEGEFIVPGVDLTEFTQGKYYLIIKKPITQKQYVFELGQIRKPSLGEKIKNLYGDYDACYFATLNLKGIDTTGFELGDYDLYVSLGYKSELFTVKLPRKLKIEIGGVCELIKLYG